MATTVTEALTRLRVDKLREPVARQWTDATLTRYISDANAEVFVKLGQIPNAGFDMFREVITLPANASSFSLTPGTPPTALTYGVAQVRFVDHQTTYGIWQPCPPIPEGEDFALRGQNVLVSTGDLAPAYRLLRPNLMFLPIATVDRTLAVTYRPVPNTLTSGSSNLDVPDAQVPLVVARAAIIALAGVGEDESKFDEEYSGLMDEMYSAYNPTLNAGRSQTVKNVEGRQFFQGVN